MLGDLNDLEGFLFGSLTLLLAIMLPVDNMDMLSSIFVYHLAWQILGIPRRS